MFNVNIDFNETYGLRAAVSGFALDYCDELGCLLKGLDGGKTNNFFAPLGLEPGEEPILEVPYPG